MNRVYLDHNATTPLHNAARDAMIRAMDVLGNPSSVHAEGREAKELLENARRDIATAFGAESHDIIFTSSASEAAALACAGRDFSGSNAEHDCVAAWLKTRLPLSARGQAVARDPLRTAVQLANSETGILNQLPAGIAFCDMTQAFGKISTSFTDSGAVMACASAHKMGGPKGVGCLILRRGTDLSAHLRGGGQEMGRRAGTENLIGIAGFAAAAKQATQDVAQGKWERVKKLRIMLEERLESAQKDIVLVGKDTDRLPNTLCFATPNWKSETQVMQMDLAGFAVSAGSACSSGKVNKSKVLAAMGYEDRIAASAIRVSLGLDTTEDEIMRFADTWLSALEKFLLRKAG